MAGLKKKKTKDDGWWLYVLECRGGVLYTGIAKDVDARFAAHLAGKGASFTRMNKPLRVLGRAPAGGRGEALRAEYAFKQESRDGKLMWCRKGLQQFLLGRTRT